MSAKSKRANKPAASATPAPAGCPGWLWAARALILLAICISAYLAWVSLTTGRVVGCGPDSGCDKVLQSRWSSWLGLPVSLLALGTDALIFGWSLRLTPRTPGPLQLKAWSWLVPLALLVAGAAVWFVGLQILVIHSICPYCMVAHGSGFAAACLLLAMSPLRAYGPAKGQSASGATFAPARVPRLIGLAALGLGGLVAGQWIYQPKTFLVTGLPGSSDASSSLSPSPSPSFVATGQVTVSPTAIALSVSSPATPRQAPATAPAPTPTLAPASAAGRALPLYGGRFQLELSEVPLIGSPTNERVMVSLFDYTCHHCREMHPTLVDVQSVFSNRLAIISLPMPLDPLCNPTVQRLSPKHANACEYARLGLTVWRADRTKHHEYDDWLFTGESPPPLAVARAKAMELVGPELLERASQDPWVARQLKLDVDIYTLAFQNGQGQMPQMIVGESVAVGIFPRNELLKVLENNLGLKAVGAVIPP